jgi:hypothetical protein
MPGQSTGYAIRSYSLQTVLSSFLHTPLAIVTFILSITSSAFLHLCTALQKLKRAASLVRATLHDAEPRLIFHLAASPNRSGRSLTMARGIAAATRSLVLPVRRYWDVQFLGEFAKLPCCMP